MDLHAELIAELQHCTIGSTFLVNGAHNHREICTILNKWGAKNLVMLLAKVEGDAVRVTVVDASRGSFMKPHRFRTARPWHGLEVGRHVDIPKEEIKISTLRVYVSNYSKKTKHTMSVSEHQKFNRVTRLT